MRKTDQSVRDGDQLDWQTMRATDQANTHQLIAIVEQHGWRPSGLLARTARTRPG